MLMDAHQSLLLVVDVQEKLMPHIYEHEKVLEHCAWLMRLANHLHVPVLVSEQYPKGLGATVQSLQTLAEPKNFMEKVHFSCASDSVCLERIHAQSRSHIVLVGIEAHVCVLQTALELSQNFSVFVVADAIGSRHKLDKKVALKRLHGAPSITLVTREMVLFEWLRKAGSAEFKEISQSFLR